MPTYRLNVRTVNDPEPQEGTFPASWGNDRETDAVPEREGAARRTPVLLMPFFIGLPRLIMAGGFSHPDKVQLVRFLMVTFSGSHLQIFLHCLFAHLLKIHPPELIEIPLFKHLN